MTDITFRDVSFAYPGEVDEDATGEETSEGAGPAVFSALNLRLPGGFTFLVGPNGIGKSTLMLLAAARVFPQSGSVTIGGDDSRRFMDAGFDSEVEERRNSLISFIYQNMEFETDEAIGTVFDLIARDGADRGIIEAAELSDRLTSPMHELSKGEMQRAIVAMSVLYGSPVVMMDEPVFAVEPARTERLFQWLREYCRRRSMDIYVSVHDVELARRYADAVILMHQDGVVESGSADTLLERRSLENAFKAPYDTLYRRQNLYRQLLRGGM